MSIRRDGCVAAVTKLPYPVLPNIGSQKLEHPLETGVCVAGMMTPVELPDNWYGLPAPALPGPKRVPCFLALPSNFRRIETAHAGRIKKRPPARRGRPRARGTVPGNAQRAQESFDAAPAFHQHGVSPHSIHARSRRPTRRNPNLLWSRTLGRFSGKMTACKLQIPQSSLRRMRERSNWVPTPKPRWDWLT